MSFFLHKHKITGWDTNARTRHRLKTARLACAMVYRFKSLLAILVDNWMWCKQDQPSGKKINHHQFATRIFKLSAEFRVGGELLDNHDVAIIVDKYVLVIQIKKILK